jgi:ribokinase
MYDVITFGSATLDLSVMMPDELIVCPRKTTSQKKYVIKAGSKIDLKDIYFGFGGGGLNTASAFKNQGFEVAYCGAIGDDIPGREIIEFLDKQGIDVHLVQKIQVLGKYTNHSVILDNSKTDRTVLAYRGASELLSEENLPYQLQAKWYYLAPLSGKLSHLTQNILDLAKENNIKTAVNFGNSQLRMKKMKPLLEKIDVLILNKEEASFFTGIDYKKEEKIIEALANKHKQGINVMTKGADGVIVIADGKVYEAKLKPFKVIDETGAGDAFGSGFISGLIQKSDIVSCICLGLTNSKYAIKTRGATTGLLIKKDNYLVEKEKIKVQVRELNL